MSEASCLLLAMFAAGWGDLELFADLSASEDVEDHLDRLSEIWIHFEVSRIPHQGLEPSVVID